MPEESFLIICPNQKCQKKIEEPILATIRSVSPPKQYIACPYCFSELEPGLTEKNEIHEPILEKTTEDQKIEPSTDLSVKTVLKKENNSGPKFLGRVKSIISKNGKSKNEIKKQTEKKSTEKKEGKLTGCQEAFGYLANRPKDSPIPQECLSCPKMVDCMLSPREE
ncbi:hypothetical protein KJN74_00725 [Candidatus Bathyarchaeota archaeon]|nr:hypothetical protein [Candidatus Bathyarchaeota archaeon]